MTDSKELFLKDLSDLRELALKGADADAKKFDTLAKRLLWNVKSRRALPMDSEHMEFIMILTTSGAGGEYWRGYGEALTDFLLPLQHSSYPQNNFHKPEAPTSPLAGGTDLQPDTAETVKKSDIFIYD